MTKAQLPTQAEIKEILHYDPVTGIFRWRVSRTNSIKPWDIAGGKSNGYLTIGIGNVLHYAHRLAWLYMNGAWPKNSIDHIDGVKTNNAWSNLREATQKQNCENQPVRKNNTSGFRGVTWYKKYQKWTAKVQHNLKFIHVGYFDTAEEAGKAAAAKRAELFTHDSRL